MKQFLLLIFVFLFCAIYGFGQTNDSSILREAITLRDENKCDEAIVKLNKAIEIEHKNAWLYLERAKCFRALKRNESVFEDIQTVFRLSPNDKELLEAGESELLADERHEKLVQLSDILIANDATNAAAYRIRALSKLKLKKFAGAIDDFLQSIELEPLTGYGRVGIIFMSLKGLENDKGIFFHYGRVMNFYEELIKELNIKSQIKSDDEFYKSLIERALMQYGTMIHPLSMDLADLYIAHGEINKANDVLNKMVQIEPKIYAYGYRYNYFKRKGRYEEAAEDYTIFTELVGNVKDKPKLKAKFFIERGDLYVLAQKYEKAIADYESAILNYEEIATQANEKIALAKLKLQK